MKLLATIGWLTVMSIWAALALNFPQIIMATAIVSTVVGAIYIWDLQK
jgi:hypothetical protein